MNKAKLLLVSTFLALGAVHVLTERRGVGRGQQTFSGAFGLGAGYVWVYSFVTQKCRIETPDKGPHES